MIMKQNRKVWFLFPLTGCVILGIILFFAFDSNSKDVKWDIVIRYHWSDPLAGAPIIDEETLYIDSNQCVGKVSYEHYRKGYVETKQFKIEKENIHNILQLTEQGKPTIEEVKSNNVTSKYESVSVYIISFILEWNCQGG